MFRRPSPPVQPSLDLELPVELQENFQATAVQYNQGQRPATAVSQPEPKRKGSGIPTHLKETAIAIALWGFVWVLVRSVGGGLDISLPAWSMALPLGVVVVVSLCRPCGLNYWRNVTYALLGHYLAVLLV